MLIALVSAQPAPFLIAGLAVYDNAMPYNNLTPDINLTPAWGGRQKPLPDIISISLCSVNQKFIVITDTVNMDEGFLHSQP